MPLEVQSEDEQEFVTAHNPLTDRRGQEAPALGPTEVLAQTSTHCTRSVLIPPTLTDTIEKGTHLPSAPYIFLTQPVGLLALVNPYHLAT